MRSLILLLALSAIACAKPTPESDSSGRLQKAVDGFTLYATLDLGVKDWRFALVESRQPPPQMLDAVGLDAGKALLGTIARGQKVRVVVVPSKVWHRDSLLPDVHKALQEIADERGLTITLPKTAELLHGEDAIKADLDRLCEAAASAKDEGALRAAAIDALKSPRSIRTLDEAFEKPVGVRALSISLFAAAEGKRIWRCAALEKLWPPSANAKTGLENLAFPKKKRSPHGKMRPVSRPAP